MSVRTNISLNTIRPSVTSTYDKLLWTSNLNYISYNNVEVYSNAIRINKGAGFRPALVSQADVDTTMSNLQNLYYNSNLRLTVTTTGITVNGNVSYTGTAAPSDMTLKDVVSYIENPLEKLSQISTFKFVPNELGLSLGMYYDDHVKLGVSAQDVRKVFPEIVSLSTFDMSNLDTGEIVSKSGSNYLTVSYHELVPILIEGIKELKHEVDMLKNR